jgi:phospholipase C
VAVAATPAPIKHVWIITLENESADTTYGPDSPAKYLNNTLRKQGVYLDQYYGTGHASLDNYISMLSGQGANAMTQADCLVYTDVVPGTIGLNGQSYGQGCVYPPQVLTLVDQLDAKGLTWKGYMQDMGNTPSREAATCAHPALNTVDRTQSATPTDNYATRHNPFVYFHSVIDEPSCNTNVVSLKPLVDDLRSAATTPAFSFITPSLCEDGHDAPCADGRPGGLVSADAFVATWAPRILASPAFAEGGMLIVNFDESEVNDATACCGQQPNPGGSPLGGITGPGGGRTGAVVVSSRTAANTTSKVPYNHYSLLRSLEDLFGVGHLGFAGLDGLAPFGADVYNAPSFGAGTGSDPEPGSPSGAPAARVPTTPSTGGGDAGVGLGLAGVALALRGLRRRAL